MDHHFYLIYHCVSFESYVLHEFESYLEHLSCINILCAVLERGGLKIDIEIGLSVICFQRRPQQVCLRQLHCDVECFEIHKRCIFPILPVNVPRS